LLVIKPVTREGKELIDDYLNKMVLLVNNKEVKGFE